MVGSAGDGTDPRITFPVAEMRVIPTATRRNQEMWFIAVLQVALYVITGPASTMWRSFSSSGRCCGGSGPILATVPVPRQSPFVFQQMLLHGAIVLFNGYREAEAEAQDHFTQTDWQSCLSSNRCALLVKAGRWQIRPHTMPCRRELPGRSGWGERGRPCKQSESAARDAPDES